MDPATIKLFLVNGDPNGLRTAELSNWSGKAIAAPRTEISALRKREELASPGFYLLTGVDPESGDRTLYIGEAENVSVRLRQHLDKDYWNAATIFVSKDANLTKAHIKYAEGKLIKIAEANQILMNSTSSGARLPESDAAEMDVFLQKAFQLLPVLGITDFTKNAERSDTENDLLHCHIKGLTARGKRTSGGFTVLAGSQAVVEHRPSAAATFRKSRDDLEERGVLKREEDCLRFTKDVEFGSPSMAAAIVRGGSSNGLKVWKGRDGKSLKELEEAES